MVALREFELKGFEEKDLERILSGGFVDEWLEEQLSDEDEFDDDDINPREKADIVRHVLNDIAGVLEYGDGDDYCGFIEEHMPFLSILGAEFPEIRKLVMYGYRLGVINSSGACMNNLGALYYMGDIVEQDYQKAAALYEAAADAGCYQGMINLGYIYEYGRTGEPDYQKAYECYALACALAPSAEATYKLGDMYSRGKAVARNISRAYELYNRSLDLAETDELKAQAAIRVAKCIMNGDAPEAGEQSSLLRALHLYQIAEVGLRKDIDAGATYYRKRLAEAIEGQQNVRALLDVSESFLD